MMSRIVLILLVLSVLSSETSAWGNWTYSSAASDICQGFGCKCASSIQEGVAAPDSRFRDNPSHHCFGLNQSLSQIRPWDWSQTQGVECPTLDKATTWLDAAANDSTCRRWYDIGVALHYYLDSRGYWNSVANANKSCQQEQEDEIDDYLRFGGQNWKSCTCGACATSEDFDGWLLEYRERLKPLVSAEQDLSPSAVILSNGLDRAACQRLGSYLSSQNVSVTQTGVDGFASLKNHPMIIVAGGQNSPDIGAIVDGILTDDDKASILRSILTGYVQKKTDVWVGGQTVYFIAGWGVNETADGLWSSRDILRDEALSRGAPPSDEEPECVTNIDCGTPYWGPYICSTKKTAARVTYSPTCLLGRCVQKAGLPSTRGCGDQELCLPSRGCLAKDRMSQYEGVRVPAFISWLSADYGTTIIGKGYKLVLYAKSNLNQTMKCQYYDKEWTDMGILAMNKSLNDTLEVLFNMTSDSIGSTKYLKRIRCGNDTSTSGEFNTLYYAEHNFTLMNMAPPLIFTFSLHPQSVSLKDCFDKANVTLRVENLCSHNITCSYSVGGLRGKVDLLPVGQTYNITSAYWTWGFINETTYDYLDYYSGADFPNGTYTTYDENDTLVTRNYSTEAQAKYANEPKNLTIRIPYFLKNLTVNGTYYWDYPHWSEGQFIVTSRECTVNRVPVSVSCTDKYNQTPAQQKKEIILDVKSP